jgi:hypothetical protein
VLIALLSVSVLLGATATQPPAVAAATAIPRLDVPFFSQYDGRWSGKVCKGSTIGANGCALTSLAMVYAYYGVALPGTAGMSPAILDDYLTLKGYLNSGCEFPWLHFAPGLAPASAGAIWKTVAAGELASGRPVIAEVQYTASGTHTHFVVITGQTSGGDFFINDPAAATLDKTATLFTEPVPNHTGVHYQFVRLRVVRPTGSRVVVVDDDTSSYFHKYGSSWYESKSSGYAGHYRYHYSPDTSDATWNVSLPGAGTWRVYVWTPKSTTYSGATWARYSVSYSATSSWSVYISQVASPDTWVLLGTFNFPSTDSHVTLGTYTPGDKGSVVFFDAVKYCQGTTACPGS